ncbi:(2E,6E)-farnesyl diphosphate synthase [Vibrio campbellii]|jgi:farnesyl diphosphate synthase|uniref:(2E,6E)-farnesyl diphosphate synthase n=1 Tax=Vibrio campbellii TaxID=680 RepID=UPI00026C4E97|nr:(2E,6E)-farnesyl diphosphate synthase [Vibrio campbellii]MED5503493.1 (2E,6E)-farnesyl diphosphate synthase [Pseudomonadota bacterium]AQM67833.1 Farnesyl diphosphate synthase [Vibrio campbellii]AUW02840.1 (2E,6E)-farnesyl diphosphate synthase [Vibrio campbellii]AXB30658.1 (2E,6E)-farnesyl diphosphate synthase [Vibrio campbellii]AYO08498.1 (2E,6E)-farnesyl diphosphate synthase [Vibrio campbellii]|tara:strand:- start:870 stop:1754 length:885 start_codon:yes stop_codon:yes gene_type:complete
MQETLTSYQQRNNQQLNQWLEQLPHQEQPLIQAMKYGLLLGGKRVRPFLVYITGQMLGCKPEDLDTPASAIECIHAYSLIHDDLPAMDDDDLRRGQPTCHIKFDEATAILTGDALQTLAFTILAEGELNPNAENQRIKMVQALAQASGAGGMCLGQALDLGAENRRVSLADLEEIHRNKTGALINCAVKLGALAAGEKGLEVLPHLERYSKAIGLAFQVQDDILDIISDTETLGKPQGSDQELNKSTYPSLLGLEGAMEKAHTLLQEALQALEAIPYNTQLLEEFARYVIERKN